VSLASIEGKKRGVKERTGEKNNDENELAEMAAGWKLEYRAKSILFSSWRKSEERK
jgi:hypothetical protein